MALILDTPSVGALTGEANLIEAARAGDDRAFEELYARYSERIRLFILGRVHDHGRAEDIAQEAFMSALRRMRATSQPIAFKPWIYEIAKNACIDEHRRARRTDEVSLDADDELISGRRALRSLGPTPPAAVESPLPPPRRKLAEEYDELASGRRCGEVQAMIDGGRALTARSLGIRERRRLARHLAHCQPCRLQANIAGVDKSLLKPRSVADKIAALLPFGIWRWPSRGGSGTKRAIAQTGSGAKRVVARTGAHPVTLQSVQSAASIPDPAGAASSLGGAAIAAAVIALAGAGGAIVTADAGPGHARRSPATLAPALHSTAAGRTHAKQGVSGPAHGQRSTSGAAHGGLRSTPARPRPTHSQATSTGRTQPAGSKPGSPSGTASAGGAPSAPGAASHPAKGASQGAKSAGSTVSQTGSPPREAGSFDPESGWLGRPPRRQDADQDRAPDRDDGLENRLVAGQNGVRRHIVAGEDGFGGDVVGWEDGFGGDVVGWEDGFGGDVVAWEDGFGCHVIGRQDCLVDHVVGRPDRLGGHLLGLQDGLVHHLRRVEDRLERDLNADQSRRRHGLIGRLAEVELIDGQLLAYRRSVGCHGDRQKGQLDGLGPAPVDVQYTGSDRGVAQPGSAHRSGR